MEKSLRRPRLLVTAARLRFATLKGAERASLDGLLAMESEIEAQRNDIKASYSCLDHVEILARIIRSWQSLDPQEKASGSSAFRRAINSESASRIPGSSGGAS